MVDLYCAETLALASKHSYPDPTMFSQSAGMMVTDENDNSASAQSMDCFQSLNAIEHVWTPDVNYFENDLQPALKPYMREMIVEWLLEVCKEQHCEDEVFPVTVNLVDRFLAVQQIPNTEFQLLASACLLIASKLRETACLPAEKICRYTENSITIDQLYAYEMFVLDRLQWDLGVITPHEVSDHLMYRLFSDPTAPMFNKIRRHSRAILDLAQTDFTFALQPPTLLAASALMSSLCHFGFTEEPKDTDGKSDNNVFQQVGELVGILAESLIYWSQQLTRLRLSFVAQHQGQSNSSITSSPDSGVSASPYSNQSLNNNSSINNSSLVSPLPSHQQQKCDQSSFPSTPIRTADSEDAHPLTPTDVADLFDE